MPFEPAGAHAFVPYPEVDVACAATGPLQGLSFGVKDLFDVAGYPTGAGNPLLLARSGIKTRTAPAVQALLEAGARFVGKTHTDELAYSIHGSNPHFGTPRNGAAPERLPGGSSSGSASAVSLGLCEFAIGTDTGGSVRIPASHCGLFGLRPSHGSISLEGCRPMAPSFDTCGLLARDLPSLRRVADLLLPDTATIAAGSGTSRLLVPSAIWDMLSAPVAAALAPVLARIEACFGAYGDIELFLGSSDRMIEAMRNLQGRETWIVNREFVERDAPPLGRGVGERMALASRVTDAQVAEAGLFRAAYLDHLASRLDTDTLVVLPTAPDIAPLKTADRPMLDGYRLAAMRISCVASLAGLPQLSLPLAKRDDAPLGLSLLGARGSDRKLVACAQRILAELAP